MQVALGDVRGRKEEICMVVVCAHPSRQHEGKCQMGCLGDAQDSIEHYSRCAIALDVFKRRLNIDLNPRQGTTFFALASSSQNDDEVLAMGSLYTYICSLHDYKQI